MKVQDRILNVFWRWLDYVAEAVISIVAKIRPHRIVRLIETEPGQFAILDPGKAGKAPSPPVQLQVDDGKIVSPATVQESLRGGRIEIILRADRFVFKTVELPSRAADFLDGVVRAQIDRLTPWSADQAAFGFGAAAEEAGSGRMLITIAATAKAMLLPLLQAFATLGAGPIALCARPPEAGADAPAITVMQANAGGMLSVRAVRRILLGVLAGAFLIAAGGEIAASIVDDGLRARQDQVARRIVQRRTAAIAARNNAGDPKMIAERALAQRKNGSPSTVIALEILSQILPDNTYVTELRIEDDKVRLSGITHDAPELIRLIERTHHFKDATFFAPITHSSSEAGDRFSIEAKMEPDFSVTP